MFLDDQIYNQNYMVMEDLRKGMHYPCILDIKMGSKAYNPFKLARQTQKITNSSSGTHGFRFCGYSKYIKEADGSSNYKKVSVDKYVHRQVSGDKIGEHAEEFFKAHDRLRINVLKSVIDQVEAIKEVVKTHS